MDDARYYATEAEKGFIRTLGRSTRSEASGIARIDLLEFYRFAFLRRQVFGSIDRNAILQYVDEQIAAAKNADL